MSNIINIRHNKLDLSSARVAILTDRNVNRLKHEVSFHNPRNLNPDEMMNHILNMYFAAKEKKR